VRLRALAILTFFVGAALCLAPRPRIDNSVNALLAAGDEGVAEYTRFQKLFGTDEVIVVRIEHSDLQVLLQNVAELTQLLDEDATIDRVISPSIVYASELDLLTDTELGGIGELPRLTPRFHGPLNRVLHLFEPERNLATIYALGRVLPADQRVPLATALSQKKRDLANAGGRILLAGPALLNLELDRAGRDVADKALPLLALVAVLFLLVSTRSFVLSGAVLGVTALGVFAGDGVLGLLGVTTNIIVDISKPLLLVLILASGMHVGIAFVHARRDGDVAHALEVVKATKTGPVILALLTTAIGFGSVAVSPVVPIRNFGCVASFGCLFGIPLTLILLPAILGLVGGNVRPERPGWIEDLSAGLIRFSRANRWLMIGVALVGLVIGTDSLFRLTTDPHAIRYFPKDHPLRVDYEALEHSGLGLSTVELVVSSTVGFGQRDQIAKLDRIAKDAEKSDGVRAAIALPLFVREAGFRINGIESIPDQVLIDKAMEERAAELKDFLSQDRKQARVSLLIETLNADRLDALDASLRKTVKEQLPGSEVSITGNYRLLLSTQRSLISTMRTSLFSTSILMAIAFVLFLRSLKLSIAALLPNVFPVALNYALMRFSGISLDLGTAMTGAIALGIAVDNTFHFIEIWRKDGAEAAARENGRAMILTAVVIGAGFLSLVLSEFGPTRNFGLLTSVVMLTALLAVLFTLTPLLDLLSGSKK
jgi:uncharacterized protein